MGWSEVRRSGGFRRAMCRWKLRSWMWVEVRICVSVFYCPQGLPGFHDGRMLMRVPASVFGDADVKIYRDVVGVLRELIIGMFPVTLHMDGSGGLHS